MLDHEYEERLLAFRKLVSAHDLTYSYSDDHRKWVGGQASWAEVNKAGIEILPDDAAEIWNSIVDEKIAEGFREQFYMTAEHWLSRR